MYRDFATRDIYEAASSLAKEVERRARDRQTTAEDLAQLTKAMKNAAEAMSLLKDES